MSALSGKPRKPSTKLKSSSTIDEIDALKEMGDPGQSGCQYRWENSHRTGRRRNRLRLSRVEVNSFVQDVRQLAELFHIDRL